MRVLGLDICKSSVSACLLTERPSEPRKLYFETKFYHFEANAAGIKAMLALKPDIAIMEPTGVNYARLWGTHLARSGVEVRLVGHKQLRSYRDYLGFADKDDDTDALALACYLFDYLEETTRFVQIRSSTIVRIRELILRLAHLNRVQSPIINRLRQDLAWQFPEIALVRSVYTGAHEVPLLWGWLSGERQSTRYDRLYAETVGEGISPTVRYHARRLCDLQREERAIELELSQLLVEPQFAKYRQVFARFGFGQRVSALLLSQIYPIENYLDSDRKPEVKILTGRRSGKPTKRHLSQRRFQKALGVAPSQDSSGDVKKVKIVGGSDLCRQALWQWVFTRIEPKRTRLKNDIGQKLGQEIDDQKAKGIPIKLVRSRICAKAARLLFKELVNSLLE